MRTGGMFPSATIGLAAVLLGTASSMPKEIRPVAEPVEERDCRAKRRREAKARQKLGLPDQEAES